MNAASHAIDATRVKRIICAAVVGSALIVPLVAAQDSEARSRLSRALLGGTNEAGAKQPSPDGIGALGSQVISAVDKAMNAGSNTRMRATTKR